mmetsp:Transcript_6463/g.9536  ORF Transcript_6463/g.9536 Transcript_6463/m.9536 type:complete len:547 (-) Transcript_6463:324-1964(-)
MAFPTIEPSEVGLTGLAWLFFSYGYLLFYASGLISEGSDLLLLVPSMAGLVGGVVLPLLGAVPDGAIMLFSGLGDISQAQESLSVGVGALAGSTIMLLTVPWGLSVFAGRVDLVGESKVPNYTGKPKLSAKGGLLHTLSGTGIGLSEEVSHGGLLMMVTTLPYFIIQGPACFLHGPSEVVAEGEKMYALAGLVVCLVFFVVYLAIQMKISKDGTDKLKRVAIVKKSLEQGKVSLSGAMDQVIKNSEGAATTGGVGYQAISSEPSPEIIATLKDVLRDAFKRYDNNGNGTLDKKEVKIFFHDLNENIGDKEVDALFDRYDKDNSGSICFDEFIRACYDHIKQSGSERAVSRPAVADIEKAKSLDGDEEDDEEEEEMPEDICDLPPDVQQQIIKKRAFTMLFIGTALVVIFSDPMVDVMQQIAERANLPPFYVSFILAPLASNASEVLASQYYAKKKTSKTISVALSALEGAASMNNTFCLSIFMGLIYFRGLAWQYTAETIAIIAVQIILGLMVQSKTMTAMKACFIISIFPLSILLVAGLEAIGFD